MARRAAWERWQQGLVVKPTLPELLPPLRMLLVLDNLTGWQKRAWRDGDWDIAAGQFFTTFRREVHVIDEFDDRRAVEWFAALSIRPNTSDDSVWL